jgi:hypothetical protein
MAPARVNGIKRIKPFLIALTCGCFPILTAKGRSTFSSDAITLLIEKYPLKPQFKYCGIDL